MFFLPCRKKIWLQLTAGSVSKWYRGSGILLFEGQRVSLDARKLLSKLIRVPCALCTDDQGFVADVVSLFSFFSTPVAGIES